MRGGVWIGVGVNLRDAEAQIGRRNDETRRDELQKSSNATKNQKKA